jgi:hypothetical protein
MRKERPFPEARYECVSSTRRGPSWSTRSARFTPQTAHRLDGSSAPGAVVRNSWGVQFDPAIGVLTPLGNEPGPY